MAAFDFKKEFKDLYMPKAVPVIIDVPEMRFIAISGAGDPNDENGEYKAALELLYPLCYTIKMSYKSTDIDGFFQYVVPPLEGLWDTSDEVFRVGETDKSRFRWTSMIRQPDFVTEEVFRWACDEVKTKKRLDPSKAELITYAEGLCVQCMHTGSYDEEPATIAKMERFIDENGLVNDIGTERRHHEIYLGDPRKTSPDRLKTVIRIPVRRK